MGHIEEQRKWRNEQVLKALTPAPPAKKRKRKSKAKAKAEGKE